MFENSAGYFVFWILVIVAFNFSRSVIFIGERSNDVDFMVVFLVWLITTFLLVLVIQLPLLIYSEKTKVIISEQMIDRKDIEFNFKTADDKNNKYAYPTINAYNKTLYLDCGTFISDDKYLNSFNKIPWERCYIIKKQNTWFGDVTSILYIINPKTKVPIYIGNT